MAIGVGAGANRPHGVGLMSDQPKAPLTTTTSIWPAAMVLIVGVVTLGVFLSINLIADRGISPITTTPPVIVGGLTLDASSHVLSYCASAGTVPSNITSAFIVPAHTSSFGAGRVLNAGAGDFDCYLPLVTTASSGDLLGFYAAQLEAHGWNLFSKGASNGQPQSLFQKGGNDGFYWVVGITVNSSTTSRTQWTYRIYQNSQII